MGLRCRKKLRTMSLLIYAEASQTYNLRRFSASNTLKNSSETDYSAPSELPSLTWIFLGSFMAGYSSWPLSCHTAEVGR